MKRQALTDTITKNKLPDFKTVLNDQAKTPKPKKSSEGDTQRTIALANARKYPIEKLLSYDLSYKNSLFEDNGLFKKENDKSVLIRELEKGLVEKDRDLQNCSEDTCLIVDVMLMLRKISWSKKLNFSDLANNFYENVMKKASIQNTKRIDLVFDSYFENSIKSSERIRRSKVGSISYNKINGHTRLPQQKDKFWGSSQNKIALQVFLRDFMMNRTPNLVLVCSTINNIASVANDNQMSLEVLQRTDLEEADLKMMLHINHAVERGFRNETFYPLIQIS